MSARVVSREARILVTAGEPRHHASAATLRAFLVVATVYDRADGLLAWQRSAEDAAEKASAFRCSGREAP